MGLRFLVAVLTSCRTVLCLMLYECAEFSQNGYIPGMAKPNVFTQTASSLSVHLIYVKDVFLGK